jgi:hypothetical protein
LQARSRVPERKRRGERAATAAMDAVAATEEGRIKKRTKTMRVK